jgi:hypothetical protein
MSQNLPSHFVQQFATNIALKLQQKDSRLGGAVMIGSHMGEQAAEVDQVDAIEMQEIAGRFAPIGRVDAALDRRWVSPEHYDLNQLIDKFDKLKLLIDPSSIFVQNAVAAAKRRRDRTIINAFFADAKTGKSGTTTTSFPGGQVIAVNEGAAGNTGASVEKILTGLERLQAADVDTETDMIFHGLNAKANGKLLREVQIIQNKFNVSANIVKGKVMEFMGVNFIHSELFGTDGSGYRRLPMWAKSGMHLGVWEDMQTDIDQRKDLSGHPWQAYLKLTIGATRLEEEKVLEIKCAE